MDQRALQSFLTLADTLHFGRAAEACHMSPSTLSRAIQQIEATVGATLFERDNRRVALTHEGELFRRYARDAVGLWDAFQHSLMEETRELTGEITMYCSVTASYSFLFDLLAEFRQRHPRVRIKLTTGDPEQAVAQVQSGAAQFGIGARPARLAAALAFKPMTQTPLVFIASVDERDAAPRARSTAEAWRRVPMILPETGVARERIDRWFRSRRIAPNVWAQVGGNEAIVSMVSLGHGVGVVPRIVLDNSPLAARVHVLDIRPPLPPLEVGLLAQKRALGNRLLGTLWAETR